MCTGFYDLIDSLELSEKSLLSHTDENGLVECAQGLRP